MASRVLPMQIGDVDVLVEVTAVAGSEPTSAVDVVLDKAADSFERAKTTIVAVGKSAVDVIERLAQSPLAHPATVEVEFGLGFTAAGRVIMAGASASAILNVKLTYEISPGKAIGAPVPSEGEVVTSGGTPSEASGPRLALSVPRDLHRVPGSTSERACRRGGGGWKKATR